VQRKAPLRPRNTLETRLWARLREMEGVRFRRKSPFHTFTLDFVAHDAGLVVSLEDEPGRRPFKKAAGHAVRDRLLNERGYVILRLRRAEVERDLQGALHRIQSVLEDIATPDGP
jgi:very-short-patch-repair endonuclease